MTLASDSAGILRAALRAADPRVAVRRALHLRPGRLGLPGGRVLRLPPGSRVHLLALGKAAGPMADAAVAVLGRRFAGGIAALREGTPPPLAAVETLRGEHPVPGGGSVRAGRRLLAYAGAIPEGDRALFLLSGGGSAIAEVPAPPLTLADLAATARVLLRSGAPIQSLNIVRRHLSSFKGGRLGAGCAAGEWAALAISDVVGDTPWDIASGPTVADPTRFAEALAVARREGFLGRLPGRVRRHLTEGSAGRRPETPKPGDRALARGSFHLLATNRTALKAAAGEARRRGYRAELLSSRVVGESRAVGLLHGEILAERARDGRARGLPACLLSGGETTVTITGPAGRGGRNQEFVLAAVPALAGLRSVRLTSLGSDGIDGPTDAAGGWVDGRTAARAARRGVDLAAALRRHASYDALEALGGLVRTGPTGTNVMDLHVGLAGRAFTRPGRGGSTPRRAAPSSRRTRS